MNQVPGIDVGVLENENVVVGKPPYKMAISPPRDIFLLQNVLRHLASIIWPAESVSKLYHVPDQDDIKEAGWGRDVRDMSKKII